MSIEKRGSTYTVRYRDNAGKHRRESGFVRKIDARDWEAATLAALGRGEYVAPDDGKMLLRDWCYDWLKGAHHLAPKTQQIYREALDRILPALEADRPARLGQLTGAEINAALTRRLKAAGAPGTVHQEWRTLKTALNAAVRARRIHRSPIADATAPKVPASEMMFLTRDDLRRLADAIDPRYRTWVEVAGLGGLRWGELAGLQVQHVDAAENRVQVARQITAKGETREPKWNSKRWVSLDPATVKRLVAEVKGRAKTDPVWTMPGGAPLDHRHFIGNLGRHDIIVNGSRVAWLSDYSGAASARGRPADLEARRDADKLAAELGGRRRRVSPRGFLARAVFAAGLGGWGQDEDGNPQWEGLTPHDLRHTSVALAIKAGAHPKAIQARLGHRSITTTLDRYGHLFPEMDQELAEALGDLWG